MHRIAHKYIYQFYYQLISFLLIQIYQGFTIFIGECFYQILHHSIYVTKEWTHCYSERMKFCYVLVKEKNNKNVWVDSINMHTNENMHRPSLLIYILMF